MPSLSWRQRYKFLRNNPPIYIPLFCFGTSIFCKNAFCFVVCTPIFFQSTKTSTRYHIPLISYIHSQARLLKNTRALASDTARAPQKIWQAHRAQRELPERSGKHTKHSEGFPKGLANTPSTARASQKVWQAHQAQRGLPERSGKHTEHSEGFPKGLASTPSTARASPKKRQPIYQHFIQHQKI